MPCPRELNEQVVCKLDKIQLVINFHSFMCMYLLQNQYISREPGALRARSFSDYVFLSDNQHSTNML